MHIPDKKDNNSSARLYFRSCSVIQSMYITAKGQLDSLKQRLFQLERLDWSRILVSDLLLSKLLGA